MNSVEALQRLLDSDASIRLWKPTRDTYSMTINGIPFQEKSLATLVCRGWDFYFENKVMFASNDATTSDRIEQIVKMGYSVTFCKDPQDSEWDCLVYRLTPDSISAEIENVTSLGVLDIDALTKEAYQFLLSNPE